MLVVFLIYVWSCFGPASTTYCPKDCYCRDMRSFGRNSVYVVTRYYRNLTRVPDLAPLSEIEIPIYIKLSYSNITKVSKDDFPAGLAIPFLNLGGNRHLEIEEDAFENLRDSLVYLNLESSKIFFNSTLMFLKGLSKLETLIVSWNNVYKYKIIAPNVRAGLFRTLGLRSLKKLKMYNCGIQTMGYSVFNDADTIEELDLGANSLKETPAFEKLRNLQTLDLSNSYFVTIRTRTFVNNAKLKKLIFHTSKLEIIDHDAFEGIENSLQTLDLRRSNLTAVPSSSLKNLKVLKSLKLDASSIKIVPPNSFSGSYCLEDLSLGEMKIKFHKDMFKGQEHCIKNLFLRQMELEDVPREPLRTLLNLKYLFLDNNQIKELGPKAFAGVRSNLLVLKGNPLSTIAKEAFTLAARPLHLSADYTQLKSLSFCLEYPKGTFETIDVTGALITCDCTTARVIKLMEKKSLTGNCRNVDTGAGIGLQTDTVYNYLSRKCPGVMTSASSNVNKNGLIKLLAVFASILFQNKASLLPN